MLPKMRPTPIGDFIQEDILDELGLNQVQLAKALKVSRKTINDLVHNKRTLTPDIAIRLGKFTQTSPQMWLNLQLNLDLWDATHGKHAEEFDAIAAFAGQ